MDSYNKSFEDCEMAQFCDLSSIPGNHIKVEGENGFYEVILCPHMGHGTQAYINIKLIYTDTYKKKKTVQDRICL